MCIRDRDEIARWHSLPDAKRQLFASLLKDRKEFEGFLSMVGAVSVSYTHLDVYKRQG